VERLSGSNGLREPVSGLEQTIAANYDRLTPGQRRVIDRLLADIRYAALISAPALAREVGVSESTVTRAAQALGFAGYPALQDQLRQRFLHHGEAVADRLKAGVAEFGAPAESAARRVMYEDAESIRATADDLPTDLIRSAVDTLVEARRVYLFGARGSAGLAIMLGIGLRLLFDAQILNQAEGDLPDQLIDLTADDALVAISFRRVDRTTLAVVRHAAQTGAKTILISDHLTSPVSRLADLTLIARVGPLRLTPSYAAGASLVNALLTATWLRTHERVAERLRDAGRLFQDFDTYAES
jgi:DNA-binding MurR/RpiR family transcriptional regulator